MYQLAYNWRCALNFTGAVTQSLHVPRAVLQARRAERQQRFAADLASIKAVTAGSNGAAGSSMFGAGRSAAESEQAIGSGWLALHGGFGTNTSLEKEYLRLTSVPKAEDVRPPEVRLRLIMPHCRRADKTKPSSTSMLTRPLPT